MKDNRFQLYDRLVNLFNENGRLGHHNEAKLSICLYDVVLGESLVKIVEEIESVTTKYKLQVDSPGDRISNVQILDIGL